MSYSTTTVGLVFRKALELAKITCFTILWGLHLGSWQPAHDLTVCIPFSYTPRSFTLQQILKRAHQPTTDAEALGAYGSIPSTRVCPLADSSDSTRMPITFQTTLFIHSVSGRRVSLQNDLEGTHITVRLAYFKNRQQRRLSLLSSKSTRLYSSPCSHLSDLNNGRGAQGVPADWLLRLHDPIPSHSPSFFVTHADVACSFPFYSMQKSYMRHYGLRTKLTCAQPFNTRGAPLRGEAAGFHQRPNLVRRVYV
ncbi:hypothetical protein BC936DRAFT_137910 [Jimgerdemannia flammicorona]|uniref:Uncharacterized protein n=1 Tax=Jimgerdemannia flammicorona TaxID=994334 RepID=A0A433CWF4_9FUNG|nr:hypothetical protein BC936DRAFT_137910 [Jimgerdemannia flammicorona]